MKKLFLLTTILFFSIRGFSQITTSTGITIKDEFYNNRQLVEILQDLETKTGVKFKYDPAKVKGVYASFWFDNMTVEEGMKGLLKGSGLKFYVDVENGQKTGYSKKQDCCKPAHRLYLS